MTSIVRRLLRPLFFVLLCSYAFSAEAAPNDPCHLPVDLETAVANKFPGTSVVHLRDLSDDDRKLFTKDHGTRCPGIVDVDFYGDQKPTRALILTSGNDIKRKAELVVARHKDDDGWTFLSLGAADGPAPVVWWEKAGKYRDVYGKKTIHANHPVIVFCGYESWAIVYSRNGKTVEKVWISD